MLINGYVLDTQYDGTGQLLIKVRIPNIHGPMNMRDYQGKLPRNYVQDEDVPYYPSVLLPHQPDPGEVVVLSSTNDKSSDFVVVGMTGGSYYN